MIVLIRKRLENKFLTSTLCFIQFICFTSCDQNESIRLEEVKYSGYELVRGIFFADGQVAEQIPEIRNNFLFDDYPLTTDEKIEIRNMYENVLEELQLRYPQALTNFKQAVYSKDPYIIDAAMKDLSKKIYESTINTDGIKEYVQVLSNNNLRIKIQKRAGSITPENTMETMEEMAADQEFLASIEGELDLVSDLNLSGRQACLFIGFYVAVYVLVVGAAAVVLFGGVVVAGWLEVGLWGPGPTDYYEIDGGGGGQDCMDTACIPLPKDEHEIIKRNSLFRESMINSITQL